MVDPINNSTNIKGLNLRIGTSNITSGTIINSPPGIQAANLGWVQASLSKVLNDGSLNLRTPMGNLIVRVSNNIFNIGDTVSFRFDSAGKIILRPEFSTSNLMENTSNMVNKNMSVKAPFNVANTLLGVNNIDPIKPSLPNALMETNTNKLISALVPHMSSASFAFAASLFPLVVRGGILSKSMINQEGRLKSQSRLLDVAEKLLISPAPRIEGSLGWNGWNMPFFESGKSIESKWLYREENDVHEDKETTVKHTIVEIDLDFCGKTQVSCLADDLSADIQVISKIKIDEDLQKEIGETIKLIGSILNYHIRIEFIDGPENLLNIVSH